jgi:hypothetical protein
MAIRWSEDLDLPREDRLAAEPAPITTGLIADVIDLVPRASKTVDTDKLGAPLSDIARLVMQLVIVFFIAEVAFQRRVVSDALLLAVFVMAIGWWLTVRSLRAEAKGELKTSV